MDMPMDMGAQHDQQQQETLERQRYEQHAMRLVEDALLGEDPDYTAWLDSQAEMEDVRTRWEG